MTFGKELARHRHENPLFANHYINYHALKDAVNQKDVAQVMNLLRTELDKVNDIVEVEWEALFGELKARHRKHWDNKDASEMSKESLDNLSEAVVRLHSFIDTNYRGFQNIMKKCTEMPETASCAWFGAKIEAASFRQHPFDELLVPLGRLYSSYRGAKGAAVLPTLRELVAQALPASGEGSAQVFFVPASLLMKTKVALLQLLSPAASIVKAKTTQGTRDASRYTAAFGQRLTQVFFESAGGCQYAERMRRRVLGFPAGSGPKGILLQCRMGPPPAPEAGMSVDPADPTREVLVEVHDNRYEITTAVVPQKAMLGLLAGKASGSSPAEVAAASSIKELQLRPAVSASSVRSAFTSAPTEGHPGTELVTIDEQVVFRDEASQTDSKAWCIAASRSLADTHIRGQVEFVGAILKVWLPPAAASTLLGQLDLAVDEMKSVPGFSEALHGIAFLHRELANPLPSWIPSESLGGGGAQEGRRSSLVALPQLPQQSPHSVSQPKSVKAETPAASRSSASVAPPRLLAWCRGPNPDAKLQVDCKTPLAIERTLLRWMRSTVLLASLSALLMGGGGWAGQLNGLLLGCVCLLFAVLPLLSYLDRSRQLSSPNSKQPKVDRAMPRTLALSFCAVLLSTVLVSTLGYE